MRCTLPNILLSLFLIFGPVTSSSPPDWNDVNRDVFIEFDFESYLLTISTDGVTGVEGHSAIAIYDTDETFVGSIDWNFLDFSYFIRFCKEDWTSYFSNVPTDVDKIWKIAKTSTHLIVFCNDVEVLKYAFEDTTEMPDCVSKWSVDGKQIKFQMWETTSVEYLDGPYIRAISKEIERGTEAVITCKVEGVTAYHPIMWTAVDNGPNIRSTPGFDIGDSSFDSDTFTLTYTLTVEASATDQDDDYFCYLTGSDGSVIAFNSVDLNVYEVETTSKLYATARDAVMECEITGVTTALSVTWENSAGSDVKDMSGYTVDEGSVSDDGKQTSKLTITPTVILTYDATTTFTCIVRSGEFPDHSPDVRRTLMITKLVYEVITFNREEEMGADMTISCEVKGISEPVTVTWSTSSDGDGLPGYEPEDYEMGGGEDTYSSTFHSQWSTLLVKAHGNDEDVTFYCQVTSWEWDLTKDPVAVHLKVFGLDAPERYVATATDVVLSCIATDVDFGADLTISWLDDQGNVLSSSYSQLPGIAYDDKQTAILTVTPALMGTLEDKTTFLCVATSSQYSEHSDTVQTSMAMRKLEYEVVANSKEVEKGSDAMISCQITGIPSAVTVVWSATSGSGDLTSETDSYIVDDGIYDYENHSQTSSLTVLSTANTADQTFYCRVTSTEWAVTVEEHVIELKVFEISAAYKFVSEDELDVVLTCSISGITTATTVTWLGHDTKIIEGNVSYTISQGDVRANVQESTLTIAHGAVQDMADTTVFTCLVQSGEYAEHSPEFTDVTILMRPQLGYSWTIVVITAVISAFGIGLIVLIVGIVCCVKRRKKEKKNYGHTVKNPAYGDGV